MRLLFWRKRKEDYAVTTTRDSEALRAKERALLSQREASRDHNETRALASKARIERTTNHFGPMIYNAMRPK
jgi:hypothetical protein